MAQANRLNGWLSWYESLAAPPVPCACACSGSALALPTRDALLRRPAASPPRRC